MKRLALILFAILSVWSVAICSAQPPRRVPAYRGVIERVQPDGDTLHIYLRGDEWSHFSMTVDGYEVRENKKGKTCYVYQKKNGEKKVSCRQAHDEKKRSKCEKRWLEKKGILHKVVE